MGASVGQVGPGEVMVAQTELRAGGMGLWSIIAQAVTHIAPAMGFLTGATFIAANSGRGVSLAYFAAFPFSCFTFFSGMPRIGLPVTRFSR